MQTLNYSSNNFHAFIILVPWEINIWEQEKVFSVFLLSITKDRLRKSMHLDSRYAYTNYKYVKFCDSAVVRSRDGVVVKVLDSQLQYTLHSMWPGFNSVLVLYVGTVYCWFSPCWAELNHLALSTSCSEDLSPASLVFLPPHGMI